LYLLYNLYTDQFFPSPCVRFNLKSQARANSHSENQFLSLKTTKELRTVIKLSVILPCYNGAKTIAAQLEALATQQWSEPWELIVANNGSTDGSMVIVEQYRDRLPHLRILEVHTPGQPRGSVTCSYNKAIQVAQGEAVVFCEADDEVAPGWLAAMGNALVDHDLVVGRLDYWKLNPDWLVLAYGDQYGDRPQETGPLQVIEHPPYLPFGSGCNFGMKLSLYRQVGPLNESYPCVYDTDYCWKAQLQGFHLQFVPEAVIHYRLRHTLQGMFRQAKNWGRETPRLHVSYGAALPGKHPLLRLVRDLGPYSLKGLKLYLKALRYEPGAQGQLAIWMWSWGYRVGQIQGIAKDFPVQGLIRDIPWRQSSSRSLNES
jgi:glycosyltransferase involved in cell wall biosynthesis